MAKQQPSTPARPQPTQGPTNKASSGPARQEIMPRNENTKVARASDVPDYIKQGGSRGNEDVGMADMVIPRIEIAQALSPCLDSSKPEYIEGCAIGDMYNTVTREVYGKRLPIVPVLYKKQWLGWRDREEGGGFCGAYDTYQACMDRIKEQENPDDWEATETAQQLVLVIRPDDTVEEAMVSMSRTKMKVSRQWNALIRLNGNDRFSRLYMLITVDETNNVNQSYKNFNIVNAGFPEKEIYDRAEALYTSISSGARNMVMDTSDMPVEENASAGGKREY